MCFYVALLVRDTITQPQDKTQLGIVKKNRPVDVEIRISKLFCDYNTLNNNMQ